MTPIFLALPSYDGNARNDPARALGTTRPFFYQPCASSLLAFGFNVLWAHALNRRAEHGHRWFAMIHADIEPVPGWIDTLIAEAEKHDADVMSAVVPIKGPSGSLSTALADTDEPWELLCRLTTRQANHPEFPVTFDADTCADALRRLPGELQSDLSPTRLLVNTGCFVARLDQSWSEGVRFTVRDEIVRCADGAFRPRFIPEDWDFSVQVARMGGKVMATKAVPITHHGEMAFRSTDQWGQATDVIRSAPSLVG